MFGSQFVVSSTLACRPHSAAIGSGLVVVPGAATGNGTFPPPRRNPFAKLKYTIWSSLMLYVAVKLGRFPLACCGNAPMVGTELPNTALGVNTPYSVVTPFRL